VEPHEVLRLQLYNSDISDWKISFVDTGLRSNIGQRLKAVEKHLAGEQVFLANYADGLTDMPLPAYLENFYQQGKVASFLCVQPSQSFHLVSFGDQDVVTDILPVRQANIWINGGFFAFRTEIFDYLCPGEELVLEPFQRLIAKRELIAYRYGGFFACMDTFKEKQQFDDMFDRGETSWMVWRQAGEASSNGAAQAVPASRGA
jgi:glucose-1-phosphate cytidylyltransferase